MTKREASIKAHEEYQKKIFGDVDENGKPLLRTLPDNEDKWMFMAGLRYGVKQVNDCTVCRHNSTCIVESGCEWEPSEELLKEEK